MSDTKKRGARPPVGVGAVVEIPTRRGLAYAQMSHDHPTHGPLLRVLPGFHAERPQDLGPVVAQRESFVAFFPLKHAVRQNIFEIVGQAELPETARTFPLFRAGVPDRDTRKVKLWWFWDGEKEWRVGSIDAKQRRMPLREVVNDTLLVERIEQDWTPERDGR